MNNLLSQLFLNESGLDSEIRLPFLRVVFFIIFILLFFLNNTAFAKTVNVFFAGGQSNATALWANSISSALVASSKFQDVLLVHQYHAGTPLSYWHDGTAPGDNYSDDFFDQNGGGAALLEQANAGVVSSGDNYVFSGLFWFQGETDRFAPMRNTYIDNFNAMLDELYGDLAGHFDPAFQFVLALVDMDEINYAPGAALRSDVDALRGVQQQLVASSVYNGYYLDTKGYTRKDLWHLDAASQVQFGVEMGQSFAENYSPVPIPGAFLLLSSGFACVLGGRRRFKRHLSKR